MEDRAQRTESLFSPELRFARQRHILIRTFLSFREYQAKSHPRRVDKVRDEDIFMADPASLEMSRRLFLETDDSGGRPSKV